MDVTTLTYTGTGNYIDLTKALTLANARGYDQFKGDKPQAYLVTARLSNPANSIETIPTGWVQRNALVKTAAAWRAMLRKAGVKKSELNTYGKELRVAFDATHSANFGVSGQEIIPDGLSANYATGEYTADGEEILVATIAAASGLGAYDGNRIQHAFDHTTMTLPSMRADADAGVWKGHVIGNEDSAIIHQYVDSRKGSVDVEDTDLEGSPNLDPESYLTRMLSVNEETSDDVIEDIKDYGDFRPYSIAKLQTYTTDAIAANANVAGQDTQFIAPLGLLKWNGNSSSDKLFVTVQAITDM